MHNEVVARHPAQRLLPVAHKLLKNLAVNSSDGIWNNRVDIPPYDLTTVEADKLQSRSIRVLDEAPRLRHHGDRNEGKAVGGHVELDVPPECNVDLGGLSGKGAAALILDLLRVSEQLVSLALNANKIRL